MPIWTTTTTAPSTGLLADKLFGNQKPQDNLLFRNRGADIGGSRPPVEGRGIPKRGKGAPEWNNADAPAASDSSPTGGLKGHAGKHEVLGKELTSQEYYDQAVENMNFGAKFEYTHNGQIKTGYLTKTGDDTYLFTGCSRNSKRIFTHYEMTSKQLKKIGITLNKNESK